MLSEDPDPGSRRYIIHVYMYMCTCTCRCSCWLQPGNRQKKLGQPGEPESLGQNSSRSSLEGGWRRWRGNTDHVHVHVGKNPHAHLWHLEIKSATPYIHVCTSTSTSKAQTHSFREPELISFTTHCCAYDMDTNHVNFECDDHESRDAGGSCHWQYKY